MNCPFKMYLTISDRTVEDIALVYPEGQRDRAELLCQKILPELMRLEQSVAEALKEVQQ